MIIGVLTFQAAVARRPQQDRAQTVATGRDRAFDGGANGVELGAVEVIVKISPIPPTVIGDVEGALTIENIGEFALRYAAAKDAKPGDRGIERGAHDASAIVVGGDQSGDGGAV